MIREIAYFLRHGPSVSRKQAAMGHVEFQQWLVEQADEDGLAEFRSLLVDGLSGNVVEVGAGSGAIFRYYGDKVNVTAIEPDDEFRAAAELAANDAHATIKVVPGVGESLPFEDASVDAVVGSVVLCSVQSVQQTLTEFKRVLKPKGKLRLMEHVRSEHWLAGPFMDLFNPMWLRINKVGCNWNRRTFEAVRDAGFTIASTRTFKLYSPAAPTAFPHRLIEAVR